MYGQIINLKLSSESQIKDFGLISYTSIKGMGVKEEWQELLLNIAQRSCRESFRKVFNHFYPLLVGHGLKSGLSKEVAQELAQETMMKVWGMASTFDSDKGKASQWIYVIARNTKYDYLRKVKNDPLKASSQDIYTDDDFLVEDHLETLFDLGQLKNYLQTLSIEQQDVIHKIYFEGMTQQEIADEGNIPLGTVKSRVRLAIASIKELMEESK